MIEQEYRKIKQLYEMKVIEVEELRSKFGGVQPDVSTSVVQMDAVKLRRILEMRTAECEEWKSKCLKLQQLA